MIEPKDDGRPIWTREIEGVLTFREWPGPNNITFTNQAKKILVIDSEGKLIPGEGLSMDEVTQGVFEALAKSLPKYAEIAHLKERAEKAELRAEGPDKLSRVAAADWMKRAETLERERAELWAKLAKYERFADMAVDDAIKLILRRDEEEGVIISINGRKLRAALTVARAAGAAEERERCAKIAEDGSFPFDIELWLTSKKKEMTAHVAKAIAAAIRAEQAPQ